MFHRGLLWLAVVLLLLLCFMAAAVSEGEPVLYATSGTDYTVEGSDAVRPEAIRWWYSEEERAYYLFMPSHANAVRLWLTGAEDAVIDGKPFVNGMDATYLLEGKAAVLAIGKRNYTVMAMRSAGVPSLFMTTESGSLDYIHYRKGNEETGTLHMLDSVGNTLYDGGLAHIKGRGNATFALNKKPYQIKLDEGTDLCGMGKAKTWILLADFRDNSLIRNKVAFDLSRAAGMDFASLSQTVDLYVNNDYLGAYLLCEKVEIGDTRVNIRDLGKATEELNDNELESYKRYGYNSYRLGTQKGFKIPNEPEDITGGYLIELDYKMRYDEEPSGFVTLKGQAVTIKEPEAVSQAQVAYISAFFQGFENAIRAADGVDAKSGKHYAMFVDMQSLARKYVLEEVLKNRDANRSSLYFFKPADSDSTLAFAGPAWDYDAAMGNYATREGDKGLLPEYFAVNCDEGETFYIFPQLYAHEDFRKAAIESFYVDFVPALEVLLGKREDATGTLKSLKAYADEIKACAAMNFVRWPVFNVKSRLAKTGEDYQENIDYLYRFFEGRLAWLSGQWPKP